MAPTFLNAIPWWKGNSSFIELIAGTWVLILCVISSDIFLFLLVLLEVFPLKKLLLFGFWTLYLCNKLISFLFISYLQIIVFFFKSSKIESNTVPKLYLFCLFPPKCIPIIKLKWFLLIIGEPDAPSSVDALWHISLLFIDNIFPHENDISLPFGYCNIYISFPFKYCLSFINFESILKKCLILSDLNISIHV